MGVSTAISSEIAERERAYKASMGDLAAQEGTLDAKYGAKGGKLDFIDPTDPFSVTGNLKRLFREQDTSAKNSAFSGGFGWDGSTGHMAANAKIGQAGEQRRVTDEFTEQRTGIGSRRTQLEGDFRTGQAGLQSQLAAAFAADQEATINAASAAAAAAGEAGGPNAGPSTQHDFKRAPSAANGGRMWIYRRAKGTNGAWVPVRAA